MMIQMGGDVTNEYFILCCLLVLVRGYSGDLHIETFIGGQCKHGQHDVILYTMTYASCLDECRSRSGCTSISLQAVADVCRLHFDDFDETVTMPTTCIGFVFSEKKDWTRKELPGCLCGNKTVCVTDASGGPTCEHRECDSVPSLPNGNISGNANRVVGSKILFTCIPKFRVVVGDVTMMCTTSGEWSGSVPTCKQYEFHLPLNPNYPDYDLFDLYSNNISFTDTDTVTFEVKATQDVHVMLIENRNQMSGSRLFEVVLGGGGNTFSAIRAGPISAGDYMSVHSEDGIVKSDEFRAFWINVASSCIKVGKGQIPQTNDFLNWCGLTFPVPYLAIGIGFGSDAVFVFL